MAARPEGEFELVLGNRQLFGVLGIVVILLGIFFAMGFFAGRSVGQSPANQAEKAKRGTEAPAPAAEATPPATVPKAQPAPVATEPEPVAPPVSEAAPKKEEKPAAREKKESAASKKAEKAEAKAEPPAAKAVPKGSDQVVIPAPGSYLQVASTRLSEAQSLAALLRKHQFHVVLAESPKAELTRVLVGPFTSPEATTEARAKLKSLDIAKPYPVKY